jgi:hypothetical protein
VEIARREQNMHGPEKVLMVCQYASGSRMWPLCWCRVVWQRYQRPSFAFKVRRKRLQDSRRPHHRRRRRGQAVRRRSTLSLRLRLGRMTFHLSIAPDIDISHPLVARAVDVRGLTSLTCRLPLITFDTSLATCQASCFSPFP